VRPEGFEPPTYWSVVNLIDLAVEAMRARFDAEVGLVAGYEAWVCQTAISALDAAIHSDTTAATFTSTWYLVLELVQGN
jgi:hypothetical protein